MGWNGSGSTTDIKQVEKAAIKPKSPLRGLVAGAIVVIAAAVILLLLINGNDKATTVGERSDGNRRIENTENDKGAAIGDSEGKSGKEDAGNVTASSIAREYNEQVKDFVKKSPTNNVTWIFAPLAPDDPDNALRTRVAQELGSLLSVEPGEPMPPFPYSFIIEDEIREAQAAGEKVGRVDNGNKAFLESLNKWKIVAKDTDDDRRLNHKEALIEAQNELLDGMDNGISVNDSIRAAYEFRKRAFEMRSTIISTLAELSSDELDHTDTIAQIQDMNKRLAEEGIKKISISEVIPDYEGEDEETEEVKEL